VAARICLLDLRKLASYVLCDKLLAAFEDKGGRVSKPVIIIGAGLAGLAAAWKLKGRARVFEASDMVGGAARTYRYGDFHYDLGPHVLYFRDEKIKNLVEEILEGNWTKQNRKARIILDGHRIDYPIQEGFLRSERLKERFLPDLLNAPGNHAGTFSQTAENLYGAALANEFFIPYNRKLWQYPIDEMAPECAARFLPAFPKEDLKRLNKGETLPRGANARFYYPRKGGIGALANALARGLKDTLCLSQKVLRVCSDEKWVELDDGTKRYYSHLISTIPLPELANISVDLPATARGLAADLKSIGMVFVHLGLNKPPGDDSHWIYYPDPAIIFHRISIPTNYAKDMLPPNRGSLVAEVSFKSDERPNIETIIRVVKEDAVESGIVDRLEDIASHDVQTLCRAYVFPTRESETAREQLRATLKARGILLAGRYAIWEYGNMESAIAQGLEAADEIEETQRAGRRGGGRGGLC
jgi:UDP-galactopyranose mutase